jgi:hypothetical protein
MTIKYKFNKSSEVRDCVVESCLIYLSEYMDIFDVYTSQQQLKDYINIIQEPIEFIAESSIDDVLMKEWIGEWEYTDCNWSDLMYGKQSIKTGSPKLNSNWTFKIE